MAATASNLVMGPGTLYYGAFGATEPTDATSAPSSTAWTDLGATQDGVTITLNQDFTELEADQFLDTPGRVLTSRSLMISTNLAEPTLKNFSLISNQGGATTTAAGTETFTPVNGVAAFQPTYCALLFDGIAPGGKKRRVIVRRALSTDNVEIAYQKDGQAVFSVQFESHAVSSSVAPWIFLDATA